MSKTDQINKILGIRDSYQAPSKLMEILTGPEKERIKAFKAFLELFNYDTSFDWFHVYFQEEHADRKKQKQDYTPESVSKVLNSLVHDGTPKRSAVDVASGTGGLLITRWHQDRMSSNPFTYRPSDHLYHAEELSDRSVPFLLFNLMVRGMNATVMHGDALTRECYGVFFVQNDYDDDLKFSSLNVFPYNKSTADDFSVKFTEEKYNHLIESPGIPKHVVDGVDKEADENFWEFLQVMMGVKNIKTEQPRFKKDTEETENTSDDLDVPEGEQIDMFNFIEE